ncbi:hypothetical protein Nepgr_010765 [Nepenthes gracilis]|uniref:BZIP domain-containing protein n=1 Tax=Nepenthes gracilis TaxID=150966 RepID=A0AAD3XLM9_NEPGR|nr:hypothetical protein Nepgr_010765 [Nepenthes gracilis]
MEEEAVGEKTTWRRAWHLSSPFHLPSSLEFPLLHQPISKPNFCRCFRRTSSVIYREGRREKSAVIGRSFTDFYWELILFLEIYCYLAFTARMFEEMMFHTLTMANNEAEKPEKIEKAASPVQDHSNVHMYHDWAAVQAYYGAGPIPPPYFSPAVTSGHAPLPYMWAPPQMMPPYGSPYAAMYPHGGIYGHHATAATPMVATPLSLETPTRSGNDCSSAKKLKKSDGHTASGNENTESAGEGGMPSQSESTDCGTEGSCDRSDDSTAREDQNRRRRYNGVTDSGKYGLRMNPYPVEEANRAHTIAPGTALSCAASVGNTPATVLETNNSSSAKANTNAINAAASGVYKLSGINKQDEREVKREKRKQSNRESARRSRLRRQAEMEELARKVDSLTVENMTLRSEMNKLAEDMEKMRSENATLMEKLKNVQGQVGKKISHRNDDDKHETNGNTENSLSRVNNPVSNGPRKKGGEGK